MKRKTVTRAAILAAVSFFLAGCGTSNSSTAGIQGTGNTAAPAQTSAAASTQLSEEEAQDYEKSAEEAAGKDQGKTLNIYSMNGTFRDRLRDYYPGYKDGGDGSGTIGDVKVNWYIASDSGEDYGTMLSDALDGRKDASDDSRIDLFLADADDVGTYTGSDSTLNLTDDIGLTQEELSDQYSYTQTLGSDSDGNLKALTWQADPGVLVYKKSIASDVLGTDDPDKVQTAVSDWDTFAETAGKMKDKGYTMLSGTDDAYRAYAGGASGSWVQDGKIVIDSSLSDWASQMKAFTDKGYVGDTTVWSDAWYDNQKKDSKVFCFFLPPWGVEYTLEDRSDYAVCKGPQAFHWGEEFLFAAEGTDNPNLIRDILEKMTCNTDIMTQMTVDAKEFTNTRGGMRALAVRGSSSDGSAGLSDMDVYCDQAEAVRAVTPTRYDAGLDSLYQAAMESYFSGDLDSSEAITMFEKAAGQKYEELASEDSSSDSTSDSTQESSSADTE